MKYLKSFRGNFIEGNFIFQEMFELWKFEKYKVEGLPRFGVSVHQCFGIFRCLPPRFWLNSSSFARTLYIGVEILRLVSIFTCF